MSDTAQRVWRYMPFSRFVWLLQEKQLWLARVELLEDPWEGHLTPQQRAFVIRRHPPRFLTGGGEAAPYETAGQRIARITRWRRSMTFVNCWTTSPHEWHALWRIFCPSDGVAIQTTLPRLRASVAPLPVMTVDYGFASERPQDVIAQKRPMFAYEQEVRIVLVEVPEVHEESDQGDNAERLGIGLPWDPEAHVERIVVNPSADASFLRVVTGVTRSYAPALRNAVRLSEMAERPPAIEPERQP